MCPYCKWFACVLREVVRAYPNDVRFVYKPNPLPFFRQAMPAAAAALAAYAQKGNAGFFAMHDRLYPMRSCARPMPHIREWLPALPRPLPELDAPTLEGHARAIGLDVRRFRADLERQRFQPTIEASQALAGQLGVRNGTPATFVNGRFVRGIRTLTEMKALIDAEIARVRKLMQERRIPRAKLYETLIANGATAPVYLPDPAAPRP